MPPRDPRLQAAALRVVAERVERGGSLAPELADVLADDVAQHPDHLDELQAVEVHERPLSSWMVEALDRRDREDSDRAENVDAVTGRLLAKFTAHRHSA